MPIAIAVHGGAGPAAPDDQADAHQSGCLAAARAGYAVLAQGGGALDAVEAAAVALEDNPLFNAGTGSALNADGEVELDASIMDGAALDAGAVAAVRTVKNPIRLARLVMQETPHVLFAGPGAERLARELGIPPCDPSSLVTPHTRAAWEKARAEAVPAHGTIGAVALDRAGHVAAATSTGGTRMKLAGRVGDSPIIGAGTYADDRTGACSCTGHGEAIIKVVLAKHACDLLRSGLAAADAARAAVGELSRVRGDGGLILVDRLGRLGIAFNSARMSRAGIDAGGHELTGFWP